MTFFDQLRVLSFAIQNRVRSMFFEFLYIVEGGVFIILCLVFLNIIGGTPDKLISEGLFCHLFFCWFWVFIGIIGGTHDKRISEGLFCPFFFGWF